MFAFRNLKSNFCKDSGIKWNRKQLWSLMFLLFFRALSRKLSTDVIATRSRALERAQSAKAIGSTLRTFCSLCPSSFSSLGVDARDDWNKGRPWREDVGFWNLHLWILKYLHLNNHDKVKQRKVNTAMRRAKLVFDFWTCDLWLWKHLNTPLVSAIFKYTISYLPHGQTDWQHSRGPSGEDHPKFSSQLAHWKCLCQADHNFYFLGWPIR
jgi:hypothetical protein